MLPLSIRGVLSAPGSSDVPLSSGLSCALSALDADVCHVAADCSTLTMQELHTEGGLVKVSVSYQGITTAIPVRVWYPDIVVVNASDVALAQVAEASELGRREWKA